MLVLNQTSISSHLTLQLLRLAVSGVSIEVNMSEVWKHFEKVNKEVAKCKSCNASLSCKGSSTGGLIRHLNARHKIEIKVKASEPTPPPNKKRCAEAESGEPSTSLPPPTTPTASGNGLLKYVTRQSKSKPMDELLAELVAVDGFAPYAIAKSSFIRDSMKSRGYELPHSSHNIMSNHVMKFFEQAKRETIDRIKELREEGKRFSMTLDEWSSIRNRRYLNVNLHTNQALFNLGLIRIKGSCPSEELERLTNEKLKEFMVSMADIVAATTDGAAVMVKFGNRMPTIHQQCYNHAFHLAIVDVIFKKKASASALEDEGREESEDSDDGEESDDEEIDVEVEAANSRWERADLHKSLQTVRKTVRLFKNSPVRDSVFQKHVFATFGKELSLLADCKTRWNSTETMLERFLCIQAAIAKVLNDLNLSDQIMGPDELQMLHELLATLRPVRMAVEKLSNRDANLITSEGILQFVFEELKSHNFSGNISQEVYNSLTTRIGQRRNTDLVSALKYLNNNSLDSIPELPTCGKKGIVKILADLAERCFSVERNVETVVAVAGARSPADDAQVRDGDNQNQNGKKRN